MFHSIFFATPLHLPIILTGRLASIEGLFKTLSAISMLLLSLFLIIASVVILVQRRKMISKRRAVFNGDETTPFHETNYL